MALNEEKEFHVKVEMNGHCEFVLGNNMFSSGTSNAIKYNNFRAMTQKQLYPCLAQWWFYFPGYKNK